MLKSLSRFFACLALIGMAGCAGKEVKETSYIEQKGFEANSYAAEAIKSGDYKKAIEKYKEALRIDRSIDNRQGELADLINLGRAYVQTGNHKDAFLYLTEAVKLGIDLKEEKGLSEAYASMAKADYLAGDSASAAEHIDESIAIDDKFGYKSGAKLNLRSLIYFDTGKQKEALAFAKQALEINKGNRNGPETANSYRVLAEINKSEGKAEEAIEFYRSAYDIDREMGDPRKVVLDLENMAELNSRISRLKDAVFLFERSYIVSVNNGMSSQAMLSLERIIETYTELGNKEKALYYMDIKERMIKNPEGPKAILK